MCKVEDLNNEMKQGILKSKDNNNLAFIVGNGINRYSYVEDNDCSWSSLLKRIYREMIGGSLSEIPNGISFTEFYNLIELKSNSNGKVRSVFYNELEKWKPNDYHAKLQSKCKEWEIPLLTTNFDKNLISGLDFFRLKTNAGRGFTDFYPWDVYYAKTELDSPLDGFGVWHIHGMHKYKRSIRFSLSDYLYQVTRLRNFLYGDTGIAKYFDEKKQSRWNGDHTWLEVFFGKDLCVFGLGLEDNEIDLRWLLIERARLFRKFSERKRQGWYICLENDCTDGKRFFLESVGFSIVGFKEYKDVYEGILEDRCIK